MITLIHGDNIEASRKEFLRMLNGFSSIDGRTINETELIQASSSLLGVTPLFIERLLAKQPKLASLIPDAAVLWEDKEITPAIIKKLGKVDVKLFKFPVLIFQFLDNPSLQLYQKVIEKEAPELVHAMLVKRIRVLLQLSHGVTPEGMQSWQLNRLTSQAKHFTIDKLTKMYKKLLDMEYSIKSGSSPFTLKELTEQFLYDINS